MSNSAVVETLSDLSMPKIGFKYLRQFNDDLSALDSGSNGPGSGPGRCVLGKDTLIS